MEVTEEMCKLFLLVRLFTRMHVWCAQFSELRHDPGRCLIFHTKPILDRELYRAKKGFRSLREAMSDLRMFHVRTASR